MAHRQPDAEEPKSEENQELKACAEDLLKGIETRDSKLIAEALKAAHIILDAMPHEESPDSED